MGGVTNQEPVRDIRQGVAGLLHETLNTDDIRGPPLPAEWVPSPRAITLLPEVVVHQKAACERLSFYVRRANRPPNTCFPVFVAVQLHEMPAQGDRQRRRPAALYVLPLSHRPISLGYGSLRGRLRAASFFLLLLTRLLR